MRISFFGVLWATPPGPATARGAYRLRHWPDDIPGSFHTADVLRALSVMSHRPVTREWLLRQSNLKPRVLDGLLDLLVARGDLEVLDTSKYPVAP
ncbi:MAG TPA: hypothetical protein VMZ74_08740 [Ramlibacter sp.]|nr:hypothetical protein [Ramlibacter sp.]